MLSSFIMLFPPLSEKKKVYFALYIFTMIQISYTVPFSFKNENSIEKAPTTKVEDFQMSFLI